MNGEEPTTARVRRMLPSVSEVLKELTARAPIEPDIAFRAAREVCAEELKRIRDAGGQSVPLEDLVQRAFLRATGGGLPASSPVPAPAFGAAQEPPAPPRPEHVAEDPFSETTGAMDLRWDREAREPFSEAAAVVPPAPEELPPDAPTAREMPVFSAISLGPDAASSTEVPMPFAGRGEEELVAASPDREPPAILPVEPEAGVGPGDETLTRLSREAESIDLKTAFQKSEPAPVPFALSADRGPEEAPPSPELEPPPPFEDDEDTVLTIPRGGRSSRGGDGGPRLGLIVAVAAGLVALAGLGYVLVGLWMEREAVPPPVAVARPRAAASPAPATEPSSGPPATASNPASTPAVTDTPAPALSPSPAPAPDATPAGAGRPVATKPPAAVPTEAPTVVPRSVPTAGPVLAPAPAPVSIAPVPPAAGGSPVPRSRDGVTVTKDRAGQAQVFSIHFTSYKDRASAERDLKRVSGLAAREGYVAEVDLGEKGVWYRVMIGTFATAEEAKAVRAELAAKGTRDMGFVYRVVGPEAAERR